MSLGLESKSKGWVESWETGHEIQDWEPTGKNKGFRVENGLKKKDDVESRLRKWGTEATRAYTD